MKTKMIYSDYDVDTRVSTVTVANALGNFTGYATCHPNDESSSFFGCTLAEYRAIIKALREEKRIYKYQIKALNEAYSMFCDNKNFNRNSIEARKIRKAIAKKKKKLNEVIKVIESLLNVINDAPEARAKFIEEMKDKTH